MGDSSLAESIKKTQDGLGKFIKKPPLTEKNLARPPFRFLHDIVTNVISTTGFLNGVFNASDLDSGNITSREAKSEFLQKIIQEINNETGEEVSVKVSKVLAGQEPEKTNELLQSLARAIEKSKTGMKGGAQAGKPKKVIGGASEARSKAKADAKDVTKKPPIASTSKKEPLQGNPSRKTVPNKAQGSNESLTKVGKPLEDKGKQVSKNSTKEPPQGEKKVPATDDKTKKGQKVAPSLDQELDNPDVIGEIAAPVSGPVQKSAGKRQASAAKLLKSADLDEIGSAVITPNEELDLVETASLSHDVDDFKGSSIKPLATATTTSPATLTPTNMDNLLMVPTSPILSEAHIMQRQLSSSSLVFNDDVDDETGGNLDDGNRNGSPIIIETIEEDEGLGATPSVSAKVKKHEKARVSNDGQSQMESFSVPPISGHSKARPDTASMRLSSARPLSARPAPPRPRTSMMKDLEETNYRPATGKVTNVLLDSSELPDDEDDNFIVREAIISKGSGLADLDEAPEFALTSVSKPEGLLENEAISATERGFLVNQILETKKELEEKESANKSDTDPQLDRSKLKEVTVAEIEKLKALIQLCAKSANPLGKLLDYVREDMDSMQKELYKWREEGRRLDVELEAAKQTTEASLQPLKQQLNDVETKIHDKTDAISVTKMAIIRHQERIEKILSGLDRVKSSHRKGEIPSASIILENSAPLARPSAAFNLAALDNLNDDGAYVANDFSNALSRLSMGSAAGGKRPTSIFNLSNDDLDPDDFDPWKT